MHYAGTTWCQEAGVLVPYVGVDSAPCADREVWRKSLGLRVREIGSEQSSSGAIVVDFDLKERSHDSATGNLTFMAFCVVVFCAAACIFNKVIENGTRFHPPPSCGIRLTPKFGTQVPGSGLIFSPKMLSLIIFYQSNRQM
eukprot:SAG11_NODE_3654_length_2307_cov_4.945199_1_plen_141_part_00